MGIGYINGFSARCRDCKWFRSIDYEPEGNWYDGWCYNRKHCKKVFPDTKNGDQIECFDSELPDNDQMKMF